MFLFVEYFILSVSYSTGVLLVDENRRYCNSKGYFASIRVQYLNEFVCTEYPLPLSKGVLHETSQFRFFS